MKTHSNWNGMKLILFLPVFILSMAFTNYPARFLSQEILNPPDTIPNSGWNLSSRGYSDYLIRVDTLNGQNGQKSGSITSVVENPNGFCTIMQTSINNSFKGKRVKMTGYIKSQDVKGFASMWLRVDDFDKKVSADFDNMSDRAITGTNDWTKCEIIFDVPESRNMLFFGFILNGPGKIWVDNVSFKIVDNSVGKTANNIDQPMSPEMLGSLKGFLDKYPAILPEKPAANLNFEN